MIKIKQSTKHKGGRPRTINPRTHYIKTRVSAEEKAIIEQKIKLSGLTKSEAVRVLLLHDQLPDFYYRGLNPFAIAGFKNLQPLQSNLNQIAHRLNQHVASGARLGDGKLAKIVVQAAKHTRAVEQLIRHFRHELITGGDSRNDEPRG